MALWALRGARRGVVTTKFPAKLDSVAIGWPAPPEFRDGEIGPQLALRMVKACPSLALAVTGDSLTLDLGRCTACGRCLELAGSRGNRRAEAMLATRSPSHLRVACRLGAEQ
jgi:dissimilatory sulfite reductase (desulfoviridin) alpha/beta subunit